MIKARKCSAWLTGAAAALLLTACASEPPQTKSTVSRAAVTPPPPAVALVRASDTFTINVETAPGILMQDSQKARLAAEIRQQLAAKQAKVADDGAPRQFTLEITITRYDMGNALARTLSGGGVGQVHVEGKVKLYQLPLRDPLKEFAVNKNFPWGGFYGPSPSMIDVESRFAQSVTSSLTGST